MLESGYLKAALSSHVTENLTLTERMLTREVVGTTNPSAKFPGEQYSILRTGSMEILWYIYKFLN